MMHVEQTGHWEHVIENQCKKYSDAHQRVFSAKKIVCVWSQNVNDQIQCSLAEIAEQHDSEDPDQSLLFLLCDFNVVIICVHLVE